MISILHAENHWEGALRIAGGTTWILAVRLYVLHSLARSFTRLNCIAARMVSQKGVITKAGAGKHNFNSVFVLLRAQGFMTTTQIQANCSR